MRLSSKGEYALLSVLYLARHYGTGPIPTHVIARENLVPKKFLEQIVLTLKRGTYLKSRMGPDGGYELAKDPAMITMAEIIRLIDGPLAAVGSVSKYFHSSTPIDRSPGLLEVFADIRDYTADKLETTTFADLVRTDAE
ncbi:MAG: Rrf2 family transcriptional regulator [Spirochaetales bacterium]|nr:MAG: Rrf2 family transcriptional regulator [Spirochaetales bacterium]